MIPRYLRVRGFLSYREPAELDFSDFDLACITGVNGAGKSSLLDAITWALFGQARRRDDALINSQADLAEVVFDFFYEKNLYRVQRSKPRDKTTLLELYVQESGESWRALTGHSVRDTEAHIARILRLDYETFTNASFFLQNKADQFAQQRPADRKRILSSILGLESWEEYRERAAERRKQMEDEEKYLNSVLSDIDFELAREEEHKKTLKQLQEELAQQKKIRQFKERELEGVKKLQAAMEEKRRLVEMLAGQLETTRARLDGLRKDLTVRQVDRDQCLAQLAKAEQVKVDYQRWQTARNELEHWEELFLRYRQFEAQRNQLLMIIETERSRLEQELKSLKDQQRQAIQLGDELTTHVAEIEALEAIIKQASRQLEQRANLEQELQERQIKQAELQTENRRLKEIMSEVKQRIESIQKTSGAECPLCGQSLPPDHRLRLLESLRTEGNMLGEQYRANVGTLKELAEQQSRIEDTLKELSAVEGNMRQQERRLEQVKARKAQIEQILQSWQSLGMARLQQIELILKEENFAQEAHNELVKIDAAIQALGYNAAAHEACRQAEQQGRGSETALRQIEAARAALEPLEREIGDLQKRLEQEEKELQSLEVSYQETRQVYEADFANLPDVVQVERALMDEQERENILTMKIGGVKQALEAIQQQRARREELLAQRDGVRQQIVL
ncbi:MAG: SMC family ATPase, partial [Anaerolineales bacterium]